MPAARASRHRAKGWLCDVVRRHLEIRPAPVSAHRLALELRARDPGIFESNVFRALRRLEQVGMVRRVETLKSYVLRRPGEMVDLLCERCDAHLEQLAPGLHGSIEQVAGARGFTVHHIVAEVTGTCGQCAGSSLATPSPPGDRLS